MARNIPLKALSSPPGMGGWRGGGWRRCSASIQRSSLCCCLRRPRCPPTSAAGTPRCFCARGRSSSSCSAGWRRWGWLRRRSGRAAAPRSGSAFARCPARGGSCRPVRRCSVRRWQSGLWPGRCCSTSRFTRRSRRCPPGGCWPLSKPRSRCPPAGCTSSWPRNPLLQVLLPTYPLGWAALAIDLAALAVQGGCIFIHRGWRRLPAALLLPTAPRRALALPILAGMIQLRTAEEIRTRYFWPFFFVAVALTVLPAAVQWVWAVRELKTGR